MLQREIGNQAVQRLLKADRSVARKDPPTTRMGETPVTQLYGSTDADTWAQEVRAGRLVPLYAEIAKLIQADKVEDVKATQGNINGALRAQHADLKQGLNFVGNLGSRGQCGYLYDNTFDAKLPVNRKDPLPQVAIVLGRLAFEPDNKAFTLGVLRHELEHAVHNRLAIDWLKKWRDDERARNQDFQVWLGKQSMSATDRALVRERVSGAKSMTEALANTEGFIAGFPLEAAGIGAADHPLTDELEDVADYWLKTSDDAVRAEVLTRLRDLGTRLSGERRTAFRAALEQLKATKDRALAKLVDPLLKSL